MWDERFDTEDYVYGTEPNAFLAASRDRLPEAGRVLAVADGEGRNGVWLAEQGFDVLSVDASPVGLAKAQKLARSRGVTLTFEQADLLAWDWPEASFDAVVAIFIQFVGPEGRRTIFEGIKRALKPGGTLLLAGYRVEQLGYGTGGPSAAENLYTEDLLRKELSPLRIESLSSCDREMREGHGHYGMSALIDVIAVKEAG